MKQRIEKTRDDVRNDPEIMSLVKSLKTMLNGIANYEELHKISRNEKRIYRQASGQSYLRMIL